MIMVWKWNKNLMVNYKMLMKIHKMKMKKMMNKKNQIKTWVIMKVMMKMLIKEKPMKMNKEMMLKIINKNRKMKKTLLMGKIQKIKIKTNQINLKYQ